MRISANALLLAAAVAAAVFVAGVSSARAEKVVVVAGGGQAASPGPATQVKLDVPFGVDFGPEQSLFIVELNGGRLLRVDRQGQLTTVAGASTSGDRGDGASASNALFNGMHSLAVDRQGNIYLADTWNNRIRRVDAHTGVIANFAGTGKKGFGGDGSPAAAAQFGGVYCIAFNPDQTHLYIADLDNRRIRAIDMKTGNVRTVAGNGKRGVPKDGDTAADAPLVDPRAVAADALGNVYVLEREGDAVRVVDRTGKIRTVVGPDLPNGDTKQPRLHAPRHLCVDTANDVLIADTGNHVIRKYLVREKKLVPFAGTGHVGASGIGGKPLEVELSQPHGVAVNRTGTVYICDSYNGRVLKVEP